MEHRRQALHTSSIEHRYQAPHTSSSFVIVVNGDDAWYVLGDEEGVYKVRATFVLTFPILMAIRCHIIKLKELYARLLMTHML